MLRTGVIRYFDFPLPFAAGESSGWQALMFPGSAGRCTGRTRRCKAKQGRRGKTALKCGSYFHNNTVFGGRR